MEHDPMRITLQSCASIRKICKGIAIIMAAIFAFEIVFWICRGISLRVISQMPLEFAAILFIPVCILYLLAESHKYSVCLRYMRMNHVPSLTKSEMHTIVHRAR